MSVLVLRHSLCIINALGGFQLKKPITSEREFEFEFEFVWWRANFLAFTLQVL